MKRTDLQNRALHKYFRLLADALNESGSDQIAFYKALPDKGVPVPWSESAIKALWKVVQKAMEGVDSTTELTTAGVNRVYEVFDQKISEMTGVHTEFPHEDET